MVYLHVNCQVQRRKVKDWSDNYEKILLPVLTEYGQHLVGAWKTTIGTYDEVLDLYSFESMAHMEKVRKALWAEPRMVKYGKESPAYVGLEVSKLMEPMSYSPLK